MTSPQIEYRVNAWYPNGTQNVMVKNTMSRLSNAVSTVIIAVSEKKLHVDKIKEELCIIYTSLLIKYAVIPKKRINFFSTQLIITKDDRNDMQ